MRVHLVNPSDASFGIGVITPRWLYVLDAATPADHGDPFITDETLEQIQPELIQRGDVVGIGMKEVKQEAKCRKIKLLVLPTSQAIKTLKQNPDKTNAILHVTC